MTKRKGGRKRGKRGKRETLEIESCGEDGSSRKMARPFQWWIERSPTTSEAGNNYTSGLINYLFSNLSVVYQ